MARKSSKPKTTEWTEGRFRAFITSTLRGGFRRYPPKYETLKEALWGKKLNPKTGRQSLHYTCKECKHEFPAKEVNVDHVLPVVDPEVGFENWDVFVKRLFCGKDNLQVLCKPCHDKKTKLEKGTRNGSKK